MKYSQKLILIIQIFTRLKKEKYSGVIYFRVGFNQGGARTLNTFKEEKDS